MSFEAEGPSCCTTVNPSARKQHLCCECRGRIEKGEVYEKVTGIWDGSAYTFKTCRECVILRGLLNSIEADTQDGPVPYTMIEEHIDECGDLDNETGKEMRRIKTLRGAPFSRLWWPSLK